MLSSHTCLCITFYELMFIVILVYILVRYLPFIILANHQHILSMLHTVDGYWKFLLMSAESNLPGFKVLQFIHTAVVACSIMQKFAQPFVFETVGSLYCWLSMVLNTYSGYYSIEIKRVFAISKWNGNIVS